MQSSGGYAKYIATRPCTEKFGRHGLYTDDGIEVKLSRVQEELDKHQGNIWTAIISIRREDAERSGFNKGERLRDMLRTQTEALSENLRIPMNSFHWYVPFTTNPIILMCIWLFTPPIQARDISPQKVWNGSVLPSQEIYSPKTCCLSIYQKQTENRDRLRADSKTIVEEIVAQINSGDYDNQTVEKLLHRLSDRLSKVSGNKQHGYL